MARTWLSLTVELLGGRREELWPWPGRIFAVGPSHTFMDLAKAINDAFGRWDRSYLSMFTLADGRLITDEETGAEMAGSIDGPIHFREHSSHCPLRDRPANRLWRLATGANRSALVASTHGHQT
ncbi:hypothetical protein [Arthrobacter sp. NA-172]|uniref:hypothetical protein n=1 Tax=Arthrobacter sp. NA-172 TaxID=3367524 RepID=UPI0037540EBC